MTAAQATPPAPTIDVSFSPQPVSANDTDTITVSVTPGLTNESVTLETKVLGLIWTNVTGIDPLSTSPLPLGDDGTVQFLVKQPNIGNYQYRVKVAANANHTALTSATYVLNVVQHTTPETQAGVYNCASHTPSIPHPGGGSWQCMYNDEFANNALDTTYWNVQTTGYMTQPKDQKACFGDQSTGNVAVQNDNLELTATVWPTAQHCPGPNHPLSKSRIFGALVWHNQPDGSEPTLQQTYGYYEVSAKLPAMHGTWEGQSTGVKPPDDAVPPPGWDAVKGLQETFYLWPTTNRYGLWPRSGEMDFAEFYSGAGNLVNPAMHQQSGTTTGGWLDADCNITAAYGGHVGGYNTYKFLWTDTTLTTWVNDDPNPCTVTNIEPDGKPFNAGFYLSLVQAFGTTNTLNPYAMPPAGTPATMTPVGTTYIDYVRVWK